MIGRSGERGYLYVYLYVYLHILRAIGIMVRVFANDPGDWVSIPG